MWTSGTLPVEWKTAVIVHHLQEPVLRVQSDYRGLESLTRSTVRYWKGESDYSSKLRVRRSNLVFCSGDQLFTLAWPLEGAFRSLSDQSPCVL